MMHIDYLELADQLEALLPKSGDEGAVVSDGLLRATIKALRSDDND